MLKFSFAILAGLLAYASAIPLTNNDSVAITPLGGGPGGVTKRAPEWAINKDLRELLADRAGLKDVKKQRGRLEKAVKEASTWSDNPGLQKYVEQSYVAFEPRIQGHPAYEKDILQRVEEAGYILDFGTGFTQDMQQLVKDGASQSYIFGFDLDPRPISVGLELFGDNSGSSNNNNLLEGNFHGGVNILHPEEWDDDVNDLLGQFVVVHASKLFHLFSKDDQKKIALNLIHFLVKDNDSGNPLIAGVNVFQESAKDPRYHNKATWKTLWEEVKDSFNKDSENDQIKNIDTNTHMVPKASPDEKQMTWFEVYVEWKG
ncbi:Uu.00g122340.m01.CDS01 [Anthostomella pinea]|uniref:Uu.00g122340.m01.CDS01 n=1 Tax=Anthostomella pinea TaxID=933095 RepID=A0AAI8VI53_9PEZI|nr:Uu.00g122340.m01.CDS01 [Anthostomella pinea]